LRSQPMGDSKSSATFVRRTERITLRSANPDDAEFLHSLRSLADPRLTSWSPLKEPQYLREFIRKLTAEDPLFALIISRNDTNESVGHCVLHKFGDLRSREITIHVHPSHNRLGFASDALKLLVAEGLSLHLSYLIAKIHPENTSSIHLFSRYGFHESGEKSSDLSIFQLDLTSPQCTP